MKILLHAYNPIKPGLEEEFPEYVNLTSDHLLNPGSIVITNRFRYEVAEIEFILDGNELIPNIGLKVIG